MMQITSANLAFALPFYCTNNFFFVIVLKEAPNELKAQQYLVVCYIQESDFKNALSLMTQHSRLAE